MYQTIVDTGDGYYMQLNVSDGSPSICLTLDYTGMFTFRRWNNNTSSWIIFSQFPNPSCDRYASCGPFGYCNDTEPVPTCKCLDGFEPNGLDTSKGCRRKDELKCGDGDNFFDLAQHEDSDSRQVLIHQEQKLLPMHCRVQGQVLIHLKLGLNLN